MVGRATSGRLATHPGEEPGPTIEPAPAERTMFTLPDMARRFGCSTATIRRWWEHRKIPCPLKIGGSLRWDSTELEVWIAARLERLPNGS